jgi:3-oxoacyl-[acyl-carrier-protein] synthase II
MLRQNDSIWITGVGATTPLGNDFEEISRNMLEGRSGIRRVEGFDVSQHPCQVAGQVLEIPCPEGCDPTEFASLTPIEKGPLWCCADALQRAGLWESRKSLRIGLVIGMGAESMQNWVADFRGGGDRCFDPKLDQETVVGKITRILGLSGPAISVTAACASGNHAFVHGRKWLQRGLVDVCLGGACDMGVTPYSLAGFGNLRALSRRNDEPEKALRPFDLDRDGMVLGEGGAVFVLERAGARQGQTPMAEVAGVGTTSDAFHMVIPCANPEQGIQAVRQAMDNAGVSPADVDYVNAHATGTPVGDACETRILQGALGDSLDRTYVSATKSMTGHLLSAAAAVEALACLTAMRFGEIPPTINLDRPDPACALRHVANHPVKAAVRVAISNSFGFGGNNTSVVLKAVA